ncbi:MAG: penicillin-binding protein 2 [Puniceicoccales bacterium]|jgi:cell division protein FtsI/penicillin-binding protein 2|nr:penicillin-binding protein 2 [Puniceicoccales bacterium]
MLVVFSAALLLFFILVARLTYLMLFSSPERLLSINRTRHFFDITVARRGNIYDRNGVALALTVPAVDVGLDPKLVPAQEQKMVLGRLASLLNRPLEELESTVAERTGRMPSTRWVRLAENVPEVIFEKMSDAHLRGIYGNRKFLRTYPQRGLACHIVGFVNREGVACYGVEKFVDFFLRGQDGWVLSEKDGLRRELRQFRSRGVPCVDGCNAFLTIDLTIQKLVEDELEHIAGLHHPNWAVIIVSEAKTGKLLALACLPSYDPNAFNQTPIDHLRNRAVCDCYEPGSVFKIVPAAAGLEEGIVDPTSCLDCAKENFEWQGHSYNLPRDHSDFGIMTLTDILRKSSNRGSAQVAIRLGPDRFFSYVRAFGFGERSDYGFDGEAEGILRPPQRWDGLTISRMPMGHAIGVTPMQMHMAMGVIASDGYLFSPRLVERIDSGDSPLAVRMKTIFDRPSIRRQVLSRQTVRRMRAMLFSPADGRVESWDYACKTGTAQKIANGTYVHDRHVASCSGFFPVKDPKFLVTVVVDSPETDGATGWGSLYAKPTFKHIAEKLAKGIYP